MSTFLSLIPSSHITVVCIYYLSHNVSNAISRQHKMIIVQPNKRRFTIVILLGQIFQGPDRFGRKSFIHRAVRLGKQKN